MIDIQRKAPRFNVEFEIFSNTLEAQGINISLKGIGFLTSEEMVPAADIPFNTDVKGFVFSNKTYHLEGFGNLLYSRLSSKHRNVFYNGFQFAELTKKSEDNLIELMQDIHNYFKKLEEDCAYKTMGDYMYYPSHDLTDKADLFAEYIDRYLIKNYPMFSFFQKSRTDTSSTLIQMQTGQEKEMIMMGSNNYLGLTNHPDVIKAVVKATKMYGSGNGAGAMVGGTLKIHKELEEKLAHFTQKEDVMIFNSGFSANTGIISGLLRPGDVVINDQYNHASIYDGTTLSRAKMLVFMHNDVNHLKKVLKRAKLKYNGHLIVVDGVYSTDGSLSKLPEIVDVAQKNNCQIMVDEAHGLGVLGKKGIGAIEQFGLIDKVDIIMGTMSKSLAGVGGFAAASKEIINYLRFYARSYLFSTNIPPGVTGGLIKALDIVQSDQSLREQLLANVERFKKGLSDLGLPIGEPQAAIIPIFIPDDQVLISMSNLLFEKGLYHNVMRYPVVPMGGSLLRFGIMATHSKAEIQKALDIIKDSAKELKLI
ncbi:MAG: aminotransferase class I/II-fold pyridoxal phosphate-dependent enzyme [Spirochaetes bacterium]|nr:aminotransferase class I/II-fold pyridoxal phosphate-dependent enzyme [Spirochaetota bacterium]